MGYKVGTRATMGIGATVIILTLIIFFLGYSNSPIENIDLLALAFVLISEIALFGGTTIILSKRYKGGQMLLTSGIISILLIYWIAASVVSIFSNSIFKDNIRGFTTTQFIILGIALIVSIALYASGIKVREQDVKLSDTKLILKDCESLIFSLKANAKLGEYSPFLNNIYEELKYSDKSKSVENEQNIYDRIADLKTLILDNEDKTAVDDISGIANEIILLIKERNQRLLQLNQGGF